MDIFGIGGKIIETVKNTLRAQKGSVLTFAMINKLKSGDKVVFDNLQDAATVMHICDKKGLDIKSIIVPVDNDLKLLDAEHCQDKIILDHNWIERYYINRIELAGRDIDCIQSCNNGGSELMNIWFI